MTLSDAQIDRYARHLVLKEVGGVGQQRLLGAHVAVLGAGGIGCPAIQALAAAGVGGLTIIDDDHVALSNLQRQTLFSTGDVGRPKAIAAADAVARLNPDVAISAHVQRLSAGNAAQMLAGADVILDGCDNFATRLLVAEAALAAEVPLVSAAVGQFEGQVATYRGWEPDQPCYRCFVGDDPEREEASCAEQGVMGAATAVVGSLAATEVLRALTGFGRDVAGDLLLIDLLALRFRTVRIAKDPGCPSCSR
ncbi:adenylyltransferase/sulfurtransferase [Sphingomonas jejuensis]|uniref:Adenylyltransferase/sulfurtransferase n=1 Tax=Sphingomonas jejuensis TaxID=904715 RepID=A0ABX0XK78_9SPHN|nr:HesA/MoeB/ThiF family protein [Sphingomonas jejuensis]NJC33749.1 adenylyltransferase/sulfurtransferase [Sphingomonas jejuensis]